MKMTPDAPMLFTPEQVEDYVEGFLKDFREAILYEISSVEGRKATARVFRSGLFNNARAREEQTGEGEVDTLKTYLRKIISAGVPTRWWRNNECNLCGGPLGTRGYHEHETNCVLLDANEYVSLGYLTAVQPDPGDAIEEIKMNHELAEEAEIVPPTMSQKDFDKLQGRER